MDVQIKTRAMPEIETKKTHTAKLTREELLAALGEYVGARLPAEAWVFLLERFSSPDNRCGVTVEWEDESL